MCVCARVQNQRIARASGESVGRQIRSVAVTARERERKKIQEAEKVECK